jgi:glycosyltransferase involved in cell wall biosynthesis
MNVSVVMATYQRPKLLLRCIDALLEQQYDKNHFEIIVVSDGPDPKTAKALEIYKNSPVALTFLSLAKKGGPAAARNLGWKNANAELIAFTDDDCIPNQFWIYNLWMNYKNQRNQNAAFSGRTIVPIPSRPTDYQRNIANLETAEFITANCACTKNALQKAGGLDERFTMAWREDSDLQFKFIELGIPLYKVPEARIIHPVRKAKWGVCIKDERKGIFNALLFKKYPSFYKERIQPQPPWNYYAIIFCFFICLTGLISKSEMLAIAGISGWTILTTGFILRRLKNTSRSISHILEMIFTSMALPFLSIYYRIYGALKFKSRLFP